MDKFQKISNDINKLHLELEVCDLNHGPGNIKPPAVDYINQEFFGGEQIRIPICEECLNALITTEDRWILLYCLNCLCSQWVDKYDSKRLYHYTDCHKIKWLPKCPYCK